MGKFFKQLAEEADNEYAMIDSTIVRTHQYAAGTKGEPENETIGLSKGKFSTRTMMYV